MTKEAMGHMKLKKKIYNILKNAKFSKVSMEVLFDLPNVGNLSADVAAIDGSTLFIFQCKDRKNLDEPEKEFGSTVARISAIHEGKVTKITSENDPFVKEELKKIKKIKTCYAFTDKLENANLKDIIKKFNFEFWDHKAVKYYEKTVNALGKYTKNQILREFDIPFENPIGTWEEYAVQITQGENLTMYMLGIHPGLLLDIAYVYRRGSGKSKAYQRILNKERLSQVSDFLKKPDALLSNPIIIVFDQDQKIQEKLKYSSETHLLQFPTSYCCAWIIDGQHRIFGFKDHPKYSEWTKEKNEEFKIPAVVFQQLSEPSQSRTFVNINYYQKRIDPSLLADLSTVMKDLKYPIVWPNLLVDELNKNPPWKNMIKTSELDDKKPISNNAFANMKLLDTLLGYKKKSKESNPYSGVLYHLARFDTELPFDAPKNQESFKKQVSILTYFFKIIREYVKTKDVEKDRWLNDKDYGLTNRESVNGFLLVLNELLKAENDLKNWPKYVSEIDAVDYGKKKLLKHGRGFPAYANIANKIIRKINRNHNTKLKLIQKKKKKKT